jgi:radical SAM superfamily enzyme YgiQ (UPF0313 family)
MRYIGKVYRPPSEANAYLLQATIGCSWNKCTYCDMYRDKPKFQIRDIKEVLEDLHMSAQQAGNRIQKLFVTDGDALCLPMDHWRTILQTARKLFPNLRRVSCYAMASNILEKTPEELKELCDLGLTQLYIGPESGDDPTLKRIAKGSTAAEHVEAAERAHEAGMKLSVIFLLGSGGVKRSKEHALASAQLASAMNPEFLSALTLTIVPNTPIHRLEAKGKFILPDKKQLLEELHQFIAHTETTSAIFRTNHASNYLPISGTLPHDKEQMLEVIEMAMDGNIPLRDEWRRGL